MAKKERIEHYTADLQFVKWDRFLEHDDGFITAFGWIEREEDEYKDFVTVLFTHTGQPDYFVTSSPHYSSKIDSILFDENNHADCQRVEEHFDVKNCVKLGNQQTLEGEEADKQ